MIRFTDPTEADAERIATIGRETFATTFGHLYSAADLEAFLEENHSTATAAGLLAKPGYRFRLVEDAEGLAGYAMLAPNNLPHVPETANAIELKRFYFLPRLHGVGAAQQLMDWCLDHGRSAGHDLMSLSVYADNHRARRFYEKHGFREAGSYFFRVGSQLDDERVYVRPL